METSPAGVAFVRRREKVCYAAYQDGGGVWTIGVGHTGPEVVRGLTWTDEEVDLALQEDLRECEEGIEDYCFVPLTQTQYDALVSFIFNEGVEKFRTSTLLKLLNVRNYAGVAGQFARWKYDNGKIVQGLINRRAFERDLFEKGVYA